MMLTVLSTPKDRCLKMGSLQNILRHCAPVLVEDLSTRTAEKRRGVSICAYHVSTRETAEAQVYPLPLAVWWLSYLWSQSEDHTGVAGPSQSPCAPSKGTQVLKMGRINPVTTPGDRLLQLTRRDLCTSHFKYISAPKAAADRPGKT